MDGIAPKHGPAYALLANRLREARVQAGLTQAEAARQLRKPQSFISKCETGERRLDIIELQAIAKVYGVPLTFFQSGTE